MSVDINDKALKIDLPSISKAYNCYDVFHYVMEVIKDGVKVNPDFFTID